MDALEKNQLLDIMKQGAQRIIATNGDVLPTPVPGYNNGRIDTHRHREILFVIGGESDYKLEGNWYHLCPGDAVFIEPWQPHSYYYRAEECDLKHLWISVHPKRMQMIYTQLDHAGKLDRSSLILSTQGPVFRIVSSWWNWVRKDASGDRWWHSRMLRQIIDLILTEYILLILQGLENAKHKGTDIVVFLADYIAGHRGCNCQLEQLESLTGYNRCYLSHLYRNYWGKTIGDAINEARMQYVLLQSRNRLGPKEIAAELGFASVTTFWKWRRNNRALEAALSESSLPRLADGKQDQ